VVGKNNFCPPGAISSLWASGLGKRAIKRQKQEDGELEASPGYIKIPCLKKKK
jgi:hypothetical protein